MPKLFCTLLASPPVSGNGKAQGDSVEEARERKRYVLRRRGCRPSAGQRPCNAPGGNRGHPGLVLRVLGAMKPAPASHYNSCRHTYCICRGFAFVLLFTSAAMYFVLWVGRRRMECTFAGFVAKRYCSAVGKWRGERARLSCAGEFSVTFVECVVWIVSSLCDFRHLHVAIFFGVHSWTLKMAWATFRRLS